jgi:hypothetical protein
VMGKCILEIWEERRARWERERKRKGGFKRNSERSKDALKHNKDSSREIRAQCVLLIFFFPFLITVTIIEQALRGQ